MLNSHGAVLGTAFTIKGVKKLGRKHSNVHFTFDAPFRIIPKGHHKCFLDDKEATLVVSLSSPYPSFG